jgi:hypothetical protein
MRRVIIRAITVLAIAALLAGTIGLLAGVSTAKADNGPLLTQRERDERIAGCIRTYGAQYRDRCVEILEDPAALGRRARRDYEWRRLDDEIEHERQCWDDSKKPSPACGPPVARETVPR